MHIRGLIVTTLPKFSSGAHLAVVRERRSRAKHQKRPLASSDTTSRSPWWPTAANAAPLGRGRQQVSRFFGGTPDRRREATASEDSRKVSAQVTPAAAHLTLFPPNTLLSLMQKDREDHSRQPAQRFHQLRHEANEDAILLARMSTGNFDVVDATAHKTIPRPRH